MLVFFQFSVRTAAPESDLLVKMFAGSGLNKMIEDLGRWVEYMQLVYQNGAIAICVLSITRFYSIVRKVKPESSRKESAELFLLAQNLRPRKM